ncbi:hypothetical protein GGX14DRAFT_404036 [Mycena pura]|uniref:Uncharacterized protein n=1 Tax=Mycena pura TaxID=153505 RepID=A0AAD6UUV0_9AGAR|nr:hypothetical protein GGX14DRAFT_404036 [Mycena pura]
MGSAPRKPPMRPGKKLSIFSSSSLIRACIAPARGQQCMPNSGLWWTAPVMAQQWPYLPTDPANDDARGAHSISERETFATCDARRVVGRAPSGRQAHPKDAAWEASSEHGGERGGARTSAEQWGGAGAPAGSARVTGPPWAIGRPVHMVSTSRWCWGVLLIVINNRVWVLMQIDASFMIYGGEILRRKRSDQVTACVTSSTRNNAEPSWVQSPKTSDEPNSWMVDLTSFCNCNIGRPDWESYKLAISTYMCRNPTIRRCWQCLEGKETRNGMEVIKALISSSP